MSKYLSELFLSTVGMDFTKESVQKGIEKCDEALNEREYQWSVGELLDFWNTVREYTEKDQKYRSYRIIKEAEEFYLQCHMETCNEAGIAETLIGFSVDLFKKCIEYGQDKNLLLSPLSVLCSLGMASNGAGGKTREELELCLGASPEILSQYLYTYILSLRNSNALKTANALWLNKGEDFTISPDFVKNSEACFDALVLQEPFSAEGAENMNNWVKEKTGGMIDKAVDSFEKEDMVYFLNALAFDRNWEKKFPKEVFDDEFTTQDGIVQYAKMMTFSEHTYLEDEWATGFIKYYSGSRFSFIALLPKEPGCLKDYIKELTGESLKALLAGAYDTKTNVTIPMFTCQSEISHIEEILRGMGMTNTFSLEADFSKMIIPVKDGVRRMQINRIMQKTFISVDEHGTRASAFTPLCMSRALPMEVILNRPFVYMVYDHKMKLPVFMGALTSVL